MKITSSRYDDIKKQRDEYDAETQKLKDQHDADWDRYQEAEYEGEKIIEKLISDAIGATNLDIRIRVQRAFSSRKGDRGWEVDIYVNENRKHDANTALVWNWGVKLDNEGNVMKETNSWSGLSAVTESQISDLEESVRVIKVLNNMDWKTLLTSNLVNYQDFMTEGLSESIVDRKNARPDFESEMSSAELEEMLDSNVAIELTDSQYWGGTTYILPTKISDKFVTGYIFPAYYLSNRSFNSIQDLKDASNFVRTAKTKLKRKGDSYVTIELK